MGCPNSILAEQLGVSRQEVSKWEAGASKPSTENLKTLAALYDVPLEYLLNEDDPGPPMWNGEPGKIQKWGITKSQNGSH